MVHPKAKQTGYQLGSNPQEMGEEDLCHSIPPGHSVLSLQGSRCPGGCRSPCVHSFRGEVYCPSVWTCTQQRTLPNCGTRPLASYIKKHLQWSRSMHPLSEGPETTSWVYFLLNNNNKKRTLILIRGKHNAILSPNETLIFPASFHISQDQHMCKVFVMF